MCVLIFDRTQESRKMVFLRDERMDRDFSVVYGTEEGRFKFIDRFSGGTWVWADSEVAVSVINKPDTLGAKAISSRGELPERLAYADLAKFVNSRPHKAYAPCYVVHNGSHESHLIDIGTHGTTLTQIGKKRFVVNAHGLNSSHERALAAIGIASMDIRDGEFEKLIIRGSNYGTHVLTSMVWKNGALAVDNVFLKTPTVINYESWNQTLR